MGMFGLKKDKTGREGDFTFELEKEMADSKKYQEAVKRIETRVQQVREILRKGADKQVYEDLGVLLHGYASLLKVIGRVKQK